MAGHILSAWSTTMRFCYATINVLFITLAAYPAAQETTNPSRRNSARPGSNGYLTRTWWDKPPKAVSWEHGTHCIEFARPRLSDGVTFYALAVERVYGENDSDIVMFGGEETLHHRFRRMLMRLATAHTPQQVAALWAARHDEEARMVDGTPMRLMQCGRARGEYPAAIKLHLTAVIFDDLKVAADEPTITHAFEDRRQYVEVLEFWLRAIADAIPQGDAGLNVLKQYRQSPAFPLFETVMI